MAFKVADSRGMFRRAFAGLVLNLVRMAGFRPRRKVKEKERREPKVGKVWGFLTMTGHPLERHLVTAHTKSEARAVLKRKLGLETLRGVVLASWRGMEIPSLTLPARSAG